MRREIPWWARALALVALAVAAFSAGRFSAPLEVEERTDVRIVYKDRIVEKQTEAAARVETRIVYREKITTPDGTKTEREVEKTGAVETSKKEAERVEERQGEKTIEIVKRVEVRPDWRVSVTAGATLREPLVPIAGPLVLGLQVDRRIIGGLSAGLWVSTQGAAGAAISFEF